MRKKLSDIVLKNISPPDYKKTIEIFDLAEVLVQRLGVKRKFSRANHAKLLKSLIYSKKINVPMDINDISKVLGVSISQTYEELRKWRTIGPIGMVKIEMEGNKQLKGYMLTGSTVNQLLDKVQSNLNAFIRKTRRIAKDFDDMIMMEATRKEKKT